VSPDPRRGFMLEHALMGLQVLPVEVIALFPSAHRGAVEIEFRPLHRIPHPRIQQRRDDAGVVRIEEVGLRATHRGEGLPRQIAEDLVDEDGRLEIL
jgi:hypothetical protein